MDPNTLLWHYTAGQFFRQILIDTRIKPSPAYVSKPASPVVWFSRNQVWEPAATKRLITDDGETQKLTMEELRVHGGGLYRIGVARETAPHNWDEFLRLSKLSRALTSELRRIAKENGSSIKDWFASFDPVEQQKWAAAELWENNRWVSISPGSSTSFSIGPT